MPTPQSACECFACPPWLAPAGPLHARCPDCTLAALVVEHRLEYTRPDAARGATGTTPVQECRSCGGDTLAETVRMRPPARRPGVVLLSTRPRPHPWVECSRCRAAAPVTHRAWTRCRNCDYAVRLRSTGP